MTMRDIDQALLKAATTEDMKGVDAALRAGGDPNACDSSGVSILSSVAGGSFAMVMRLIEAGGDPNLPDSRGVTPLMCAIDKAMFANAQCMIDMGGDLAFQAVPEESWTALHMAVDADNHKNETRRTEFVLSRVSDAAFLMLWDQQKITPAGMASQVDMRRDRSERKLSEVFKAFFDKQFDALRAAQEAARNAPELLEKQRRENLEQAQNRLREQAGKVRVRFKP